jgi:hypothetical protein
MMKPEPSEVCFCSSGDGIIGMPKKRRSRIIGLQDRRATLAGLRLAGFCRCTSLRRAPRQDAFFSTMPVKSGNCMAALDAVCACAGDGSEGLPMRSTPRCARWNDS